MNRVQVSPPYLYAPCYHPSTADSVNVTTNPNSNQNNTDSLQNKKVHYANRNALFYDSILFLSVFDNSIRFLRQPASHFCGPCTMGNIFGKTKTKPVSRVTEQDKAVLVRNLLCHTLYGTAKPFLPSYLSSN